MDKTKIKSFSVWARRNLIRAVAHRAFKIGIEKNTIAEIEEVQDGFKLKGKEEVIEFPVKYRKILIDKIQQKGFEEVIEEAACTWFFRFIALRYMEVNDYIPTGIRVLSSEIDGKIEPDVLSKVYDLQQELHLNVKKIDKFIYNNDETGKEKHSIQKQKDITELYKYILIKQCNELGKIIPEIFEKTGDYKEILFPDNLLEEDSIIRKIVEAIEEEWWKEEKSFLGDSKEIGGVEIIGWMYQYYISEKKDEVFAALKKNIKIKKENIPAATQLFTPKWIVKYMVENSLGRLWLEGHPSPELQGNWKYYLEEAKQESKVEEELNKIREEHGNLTPEDIKVLDPCMGSGNILVYAFDLLYEIYVKAGYSEREIPKLILKNNLYGTDIDNRASQLASFALIMKARHYDKTLFREIEKDNLNLNICSIEESNGINKAALDYFCRPQFVVDNRSLKIKENTHQCTKNGGKLEFTGDKLREDVEYLIHMFKDAKDYGSILEVKKINFELVKNRIEEIKKEENFIFGDYGKLILDEMPALVKQGKIMSMKYNVVITNPPYMGIRGMNDKLSDFLSQKFPISKYDLFSVYMEVCLKYSEKFGIVSLINQHSWMFLSSFKELRQWLLSTSTFINMLHLGAKAFEENVGTIVQNVAYVSRKNCDYLYKTKVINLTKENFSEDKNIKLREICRYISKEEIYQRALKELFIIPGEPFAYWINKNILNIFSSFESLNELAKPRQGIATSDNKRFLREWFEVDINKIKFNALNHEDAERSRKKWFPYNKGGEYRKWYGNNEFVINWENNGEEVKEYAAKLYKSYSRTIKNEEFYFKNGLTYTFISEDMGVRYSQNGFIFDVAGSSIFFESEEQINIVLALLCSKVSKLFLDIMNPTYNIQVGDIKNIPISKKLFFDEISSKIKNLTHRNIIISKKEWDSFETSWNFKTHPFLLVNSEEWKVDSNGEENKLQTNYISRAFDSWKSFTDEQFEHLKSNEEELNRIFIDTYGLQDELTPEIENKDVTIRKADRERDIKSFISFAVGCMFGRYSIDEEGLVYAGRKVNSEACIVDSIIPITEEEYFKEDIVSKFVYFVKTLYGKETLEENLDFIAESIGRKSSETSIHCIRRYFFKDFYKDHLKVYKKKPIYWLFQSGKNEGFKALIYMHRYNEQTIEKVRTDYLHLMEPKYQKEINRLQLVANSEDYTFRERTNANKNIHKISEKIEECREYDKALAHLANEKISIDLDEGVKVNYAKFQGIKVINSKGKEVKLDLLSNI
jgi:type II restriction/modification system DNA methylase subunit YeeA